MVENYDFVKECKVGDIVDALKSDHYNKRMGWSRARIRKIGYGSVAVEFFHDRRADRTIEKKDFEIAPVGTFSHDW